MLAMEQVAVMLQAASLGTIGTTIFVHRMPATLVSGLVVLSALGGVDIDYDGLPELRRENFQVIARHSTPNGAQALARRVSTALTLLAAWRTVPAYGTAIPAARVLYIRPRHSPIVFPRSDAGDLYEASVNFDFACAA
jgi:hypothetical protein